MSRTKRYQDNSLTNQIVNQALKYQKSLWKSQKLKHLEIDMLIQPTTTIRVAIDNQAQDQINSITDTIQGAKYQNQLYRKLEQKDIQKRQELQMKINTKDNNININNQQIKLKKVKQSQQIEKHLKQVQQRYQTEQKRKTNYKNQKALQLRKQIKQFYRNNFQKKKKAQMKQIGVSTCYQSAIDKLNRINQMNQQFAQKAKINYESSMKRNQGKQAYIRNRRNIISEINEKKKIIYDQKQENLQQQQKKYLATSVRNEQNSLNAFKIKDKQNKQIKKKINQFFKKRQQKWQDLKRRIDAQNQEVSQKCLRIMDHTKKASFVQTFSTFHDSFRLSQQRVRQNKSLIYTQDVTQRNTTINKQLNIRLRNTTSIRLNQKMNSYRSRIKKLAVEEV